MLNDTSQVHNCHVDILSDMVTPRGRKYAMNTLKSKELDVYACVGRSRAARKQGKQAALHPASAMATRTSCCPPCLASSKTVRRHHPRKWAPSPCLRASPSPICASVELAMADYLSRARTRRDHLCALSNFVHISASHSNPSQP